MPISYHFPHCTALLALSPVSNQPTNQRIILVWQARTNQYAICHSVHLNNSSIISSPQQLRQQNFCSRWTSLVELTPVQLHNPDITYRLFRLQLKGHPFSGSMNTLWLLICNALEKHLLTYLQPIAIFSQFSSLYTVISKITISVQHLLSKSTHIHHASVVNLAVLVC